MTLDLKIKGESGATLNATQRTLASLKITSATLAFRGLAADTLSWSVPTKNASGAGTIVPDSGQVVELYEGTTRVFRGHCIKPRVKMRSVEVECQGPWWWMTKIDLAGNAIDSAGNTAERASYVFPTQGLKTSMETLIERMADLGVPIALGEIDPMFTMVKMVLSNMSLAKAFAELMACVPDASAWIDYAPSTPTLNVTRRVNMVRKTFTVGSSGAFRVIDVDLWPREDLVVSKVDLDFVTRNATTGKPVFARQSSSGSASKRQILTVSGPELADFLPKDDFDRVRIKTVEWNDIGSSFIIEKDSGLNAIQSGIGNVPGGPASSVAYYREEYFSVGSAQGSTRRVREYLRFPPLTIRAVTGARLKAAQKHLVISAEALPEWAQKKYQALEVEITGTWVALWYDTIDGDSIAWSQAFQALQSGGQLIQNKFAQSTVGNDQKMDIVARPFTIRGWVVNQAFASLTAVYKPWDYDYINPPAGLATAFRDAQAWLPYEGSVDGAAVDVDLVNYLKHKVCVANAYAPLATADALVKGVRHELLKGRMRIEVGAPARTDLGTLVNRIRRQPQANIVQL